MFQFPHFLLSTQHSAVSLLAPPSRLTQWSPLHLHLSQPVSSIGYIFVFDIYHPNFLPSSAASPSQASLLTHFLLPTSKLILECPMTKARVPSSLLSTFYHVTSSRPQFANDYQMYISSPDHLLNPRLIYLTAYSSSPLSVY